MVSILSTVAASAKTPQDSTVCNCAYRVLHASPKEVFDGFFEPTKQVVPRDGEPQNSRYTKFFRVTDRRVKGEKVELDLELRLTAVAGILEQGSRLRVFLEKKNAKKGERSFGFRVLAPLDQSFSGTGVLSAHASGSLLKLELGESSMPEASLWLIKKFSFSLGLLAESEKAAAN